MAFNGNIEGAGSVMESTAGCFDEMIATADSLQEVPERHLKF